MLPGIRLSLVGDRLEVTGTDQDLTISTEVAVAGLADGSGRGTRPVVDRHRARLGARGRARAG